MYGASSDARKASARATGEAMTLLGNQNFLRCVRGVLTAEAVLHLIAQST